MAQPIIQKSFNAGEWAPALNARVDLQKYHSGAALLENFFVDYRGGASTRTGTKYILQAFKSSSAVRLIPFQASFTVGYVLEFGDLYIRFYYNGAPVLETAVTGGTNAVENVFTIANTFAVGDWVYAESWGGKTNVNGRYFIVSAAAAGSVTVTNLFGGAVTFTGTYTSGGQLRRVYTISSPYAAADLAALKFAQNVNAMILCHPSYVPYTLTLISVTNWSLLPITFGSGVAIPTGIGITTTLGVDRCYYSYVVTAVDINGTESAASSAATLSLKDDMRAKAGTNTISWTLVSGAVSYNVYKASLAFDNPVPAGTAHGYIGNCTGSSFIDSNIAPDYSITPPIPKNPFQGAGVASVTVTTPSTYTTCPTATVATAPAGGSTATVQPVLQVQGTPVVTTSSTGFSVGQSIPFPNGVILIAATVDGAGQLLTVQPVTYPGSSPGAITSGSVPANPVNRIAGPNCSVNLTWGVGQVSVTAPGAGYTSVPAITFSAGAAAATAVLAAASAGNPAAVALFQQRLVLAAQPNAVQTFNMSQPGAYYNYNKSNPIQADDAIQGSLTSSQLNEIKAMIPMPPGLVILSNKAAWLLNGGSAGTPVTPSDIVANAHSYNGTNDIPPIVANSDILYVQAKGSVIRHLAYDFYKNIFTGTDISILSSHLFYGHTINEWAWAEEPFKVVWAVRDDGYLLSLTFLKEQEFIGWAHSVTDGLFKSVATVTETVASGIVDAVYTVVQRTINSTTVKYIERFAERDLSGGVEDAWCVDAGLQYDSTPATSFSGGEHLIGETCTGLADGVIIPSFVMPASGIFTLAVAASKVTVGLAFTPKLQTLALDTGEPTIQGKVKKVAGITARVADTLGLKIGGDFTHLVDMKDLVRGNVSGMLVGQSSQVVSDLVTGDAYTVINPSWTVPGQYCFQQDYPYPATILGVIPEIVIGDTAK